MIRIMMAMIIMMVSNLATCPSSPSSSWRSSLPLPSPTLSLWSSKVWSSQFCSHPCLFNKAAEAEWGDWKQPPKHPQKFRAAWNVNYIICYFWWHWNVNVWIFWDPRIPGAPNQAFVCLCNSHSTFHPRQCDFLRGECEDVDWMILAVLQKIWDWGRKAIPGCPTDWLNRSKQIERYIL